MMVIPMTDAWYLYVNRMRGKRKECIVVFMVIEKDASLYIAQRRQRKEEEEKEMMWQGE